MPLPIEMDLVGDLASIWTRRLLNIGSDPPKTTDPAEIGALYFQHERKRIAARPRRFVSSTELRVAAQTLDPGLAAGFDAIKVDCEAGNDLEKYMSRAWADPDRPDGLFLEWNFHHFHMGGPGVAADGYVHRSDELLFCIVTDDVMYGIAIVKHKGAFAQQSLFDIAHKNWPELFRKTEIPHVLGLSTIPTDKERQRLRKANVNVLTPGPDGSVHGPAAGRTTSGLDILAMMGAQKWVKVAKDLEANIRKDPGSVLQQIPNGDCLLKLRLELRDVQGVITLFEKESGTELGRLS